MDELFKRLSDIPMKRRGSVAFFIMLAAAILWYFLGIRPIEAQIISKQDEIRRIENKLRDEANTNLRIENLQANIADQKNERDRLGEKFPSQAAISVLLSKIHENARDASLEILRFEQGPIIERELYARIEVTMEFSGTFSQISSFINELSDVKGLDRIVNVENLSLGRSSRGELDSRLRGSFLLVTFMSKSTPKPQANPQK